MTTERKFAAIAATPFTADGQTNGTVTIDDTAGFKVKMNVTLKSDTLPEATFEVKRVISETQMLLGPDKSPIHTRSDLSQYTTAINTTIEAPEQDRPTIPIVDLQRAAYSEEPVMAHRVVRVDKYGRIHREDNPLDKYVLHNIDEPTGNLTYMGKENTDGDWLVSKIVESGQTTTLTYANLSNNSGQASLTAAWTNRATLTYDLIENLTGV